MARRIYTRQGDRGETSHPAGMRVSKDHPHLHLLGTLDELNAHLGFCAAQLASLPQPVPPVLLPTLSGAQQDLFTLTAALFREGSASETEHAVEHLEKSIDALEASLPRLTQFLLPGGHPAAASLHIARTVCRRAERLLVAAARQEANRLPGQADALTYLNRLSDLLFVAARTVNHATDHPDEPASRK
jgi:cob(I)alamin adenosyltransferase